MKTIVTNNYLKLGTSYTDYNIYPPVPKKEPGPRKNMFKEDEDTEDAIKKRWLKKKKK